MGGCRDSAGNKRGLGAGHMHRLQLYAESLVGDSAGKKEVICGFIAGCILFTAYNALTNCLKNWLTATARFSLYTYHIMMTHTMNMMMYLMYLFLCMNS
jgi:hypothetical protein